MNLSKKLLWAVGAAAMVVFSFGASAAPVLFSITGAQFSLGAGYGADSNESSGTLLDVRFSTSLFSQQDFALSAVNQSFTFNFGIIDLEEPDAASGINPNEMDNLGITANLIFAVPAGGLQSVSAAGTATAGSVIDAAVDYIVDWSPVTVVFGNGGSFRLSFADMAFSSNGAAFQTATITLLSLPENSPPIAAVPEPASFALVGMGIGCIALIRRRRVKA